MKMLPLHQLLFTPLKDLSFSIAVYTFEYSNYVRFYTFAHHILKYLAVQPATSHGQMPANLVSHSAGEAATVFEVQARSLL